MADLLQRLRDRKLVQWALAYVAFAFALLQGVDIVAQRFAWPEFAERLLIIVLAVGFFVALVLAWYHGERGAQRISGTELTILALLLAIGGAILWRFAAGDAERPAAAAPKTAAATSARASSTPVTEKSIAVLPFVNMSTDAENEFFSDGLSEEILNSLARIDGMQVVGRTSSFQFKGKSEDLRTIGDKLGIASVLEGSVRREGDRARITAQLIRASDGIHLWSQTYDRTLKDTLAVQLDIAEQVAGVLDVVLDDKQRARMREAGVKNVDAFIAYQKGLKLYVDAHDPKKSNDVIEGLRLANVEFDKATALEPDFSLAYYAASDLYDHLLLADGLSPAERVEAQRQALRILGLGATSSKDEQQRLLTLVDRQLLSDDWRGLAARIAAALKQPGCNAPNWMPVFASVFGYADQIEDLGARVSACDPLNVINYHTRVTAALAAGQPQRALEILAALEKARGGLPVPDPNRIQALVMLGRVDEAKALLAMLADQNEEYYETQVVVGTAAGEDAASIHARLSNIDRSSSIYRFWWLADAIEAALSGNRAEANQRAAAIDARPGGGLMLTLVAQRCLCGAPFDLNATPNFKARLAESGLPWPPPAAIKFPARAQDHQ